MINYDKRWNKRGSRKNIVLRTADKGLTISRREFIDEEGFDEAQKFLRGQKSLWENSSDQFVGRPLEVAIEGKDINHDPI